MTDAWSPGRGARTPGRPGRPGLDGAQPPAVLSSRPPAPRSPRSRIPSRTCPRAATAATRRAGLRRAAGDDRARPSWTPSSSPPRRPPTCRWPSPRSSAASPVLVEKPLAGTVDEAPPDRPRRRGPGRAGPGRPRRAVQPGRARARTPARAPAGCRRSTRSTSRRAGPFPARIRDVGVTVDLATHDVDMLSWIAGERPDARLRRDRPAHPRRPRGPAVRPAPLPVGDDRHARRRLAHAGQAPPARRSSARRACSSSTT